MYAARTIRFLLGYLVTLLLYLAWDYYSAPVTLHLPSYFLIFIFSFALSLFMLSLNLPRRTGIFSCCCFYYYYKLYVDPRRSSTASTPEAHAGGGLGRWGGTRVRWHVSPFGPCVSHVKTGALQALHGFHHTMFGRFISMLVLHMCSCAFAADAFPCLGDKLSRYTCLRALFPCLQGRQAFPQSLLGWCVWVVCRLLFKVRWIVHVILA